MTLAMKNSLHAARKLKRKTIASAGSESGSRTFQNDWTSEQPSIRAASSRSNGMVS